MQINKEVILRIAGVNSMTWLRDRPQLLCTDRLQKKNRRKNNLDGTFCRFHETLQLFEENKGEIETLQWVRVEEACTTPASALVFNQENQHDAIKAFMAFSRSGLGT
jgi:hypothetical protein